MRQILTFKDILEKKKPTEKWLLYIGLNMSGVDNLAIQDGEDPATLHVTLLYGYYTPIGTRKDAELSVQRAIESIEDFIPEQIEFDATGRFEASESSDGLDVIFARVKAGQLEKAHEAVIEALAKEGIEVEKTFPDYHPHMTLAYIDPEEDFPLEPIKATGTIKDITIGAGPDEEPVNKTEETQTFHIEKTDNDKRLVFGWANIAFTADGEQIEDLQHDIIDTEDLEEAVYKYVLEFRDSGEEHIPSMRKKATLVESVMFTKEKMKAMGIPAGIVPEGWWVGFYVKDDDAWEKIKNGTYQMFSIEGTAIREKMEDDIEKADRVNGCGVLVVRDGKILTGTRIGGKHANQICGPGGHIEAGETHEEAAVRETREEFGIECKELVPLGILDNGRSYGKSAVFLCTEYDGEPHTDEEEMTDVKWRTPSELAEEHLFYPFELSLDLLADNIEKVTPNNKAVRKFNPFHDALGRFASSSGFATYSANPKTKAGAMAISRSAQAGHDTTMNVHRESQGENIRQNYAWLQGGPGAKQLGAQGQLASQQPKTPPKPQKNYDRLGFADSDDADYHQLYNGRQYYQQQQLSTATKNACDKYLNPTPEAGSLYNFSQNMNYAVATGTINRASNKKYKAVYDELCSNMHNLGHNVTLSRYDHGGFLDDQLAQVGITSRKGMSVAQMRKALVGHSYGDNRILSTSYNDFQKASNHGTFSTREVKVVYKAKASTQVLMPGDGPGGKFGEMLIGPTGTGGGNKYTIVDVNLTGGRARAKGSSPYNLSLKQIEVVVEVG